MTLRRSVVFLLLGLWLGLLPGFGKAFWQGGAPRPGAEIQVAELPPEARQTLQLIKRGGPFPYARDGIPFGNREGLLPAQQRNYYREYTVPTPGLKHRGARRIIAGRAGDYWYSADHYRTFKRIRETSGGAR
ncbi:MAG: ribonuclease [Hydrogenophilales bacterium 28-61-23]|nr:MAG: ribonuclease [Hydrogenophilales bacterium 28-61-23]